MPTATTAANWHEAPAAQAILARITPQVLYPIAIDPAVGSRYYSWGYDDDGGGSLDDLRTAAVEEAAGGTFAQCHLIGRHEEYFAINDAAPSVDALLEARFGHPHTLFGPPPRSSLYDDHTRLDALVRGWRERALAAREAA